MVFKSGVPITVIPLDVTHKMLTSPERIARLRKIDKQAGKIAADILDAYVEHDIISSTDCLAVRSTMRPSSATCCDLIYSTGTWSMSRSTRAKSRPSARPWSIIIRSPSAHPTRVR